MIRYYYETKIKRRVGEFNFKAGFFKDTDMNKQVFFGSDKWKPEMSLK